MPCARRVAVTWSYQSGASERGNPARPGLGGGDPGAAAPQQLDAELTFQGLDGLGQRGLAQVQPSRGCRQAPVFSDGNEGP
jgi:hypothetical protein